MQISKTLRRSKTSIIHYCPACDSPHSIAVSDGPILWEWNGNSEKVTVAPSIRVRSIRADQPEHVCHYFLINNELRYLGDCTHEYRNRVIPLPELPAEMTGDNFGDGNP